MMRPKTLIKPIKSNSAKTEKNKEKISKEEIILPPKYYHDNFCQLLVFVEQLYGNILEYRELDFIARFRSVSEDAQCLFLRMANRRGLVFWQHKLHYEELSVDAQIWEELFEAKLASPISEAHEEDYPRLLELMTKQELVELSKSLDFEPSWVKKARKPEAVHRLESTLPFALFLSYIQNYQAVVRQEDEQVFAFLLFLYFGNRYLDMTQFVMRDLGNILLEDFGDHDFTPYFQTRKDADDKWLLSEYSQLFYQMQEGIAPEELAAYFQQELPKHEALSIVAHRNLDRLLLKIGLWLEKQRLPRLAMDFYQQTHRPPARERQVRLLMSQKKKAEALNLCRHLLETYQNATEKYFALDIIRKEEFGESLKSTTAYLKNAPKCEVNAAEYQQQVEQGVLAWYAEQGYEGAHAENWIWRGLFGLIFWDTLFESGTESIHHPFQRIPSDLHQADFYEKRKPSMDRQLEILENREQTMAYFTAMVTEKWGIFNPFVTWHEALLPYVNLYLHYLSSKQLRAVLLEMAQNIRENSTGFPDLFIYKEGAYHFVEVKSPNDSLAAQQLHWLEFFEEHGISATVMRVGWL